MWFCFSLLGYKHLHYGFKTMLLKFNITHFAKWNFHLIWFENIIFVQPKLSFSWINTITNTVEIQKQVKNRNFLWTLLLCFCLLIFHFYYIFRMSQRNFMISIFYLCSIYNILQHRNNMLLAYGQHKVHWNKESRNNSKQLWATGFHKDVKNIKLKKIKYFST